MQKSRARRVGALLVGLAIVGASACGGDDDAATTEAPSTEAPSTEAPAAGGELEGIAQQVVQYLGYAHGITFDRGVDVAGGRDGELDSRFVGAGLVGGTQQIELPRQIHRRQKSTALWMPIPTDLPAGNLGQEIEPVP